MTGNALPQLRHGKNRQHRLRDREWQAICPCLVALCVTKAVALSPAQIIEVTPTAETVPTTPVVDADDPCIWIHPADPAQSTIIGTDKGHGLNVYDLTGKEIQHIPHGNMNNVDIRYNFPLAGKRVALVTAGACAGPAIAIHQVDPHTRELLDVTARTVQLDHGAWGACMYHSRESGKYYFINASAGRVEQWQLFDNGQGKVDARLARTLVVGGDIEGCVADDELGHLYVSEETVGIWKYGAEPIAGELAEAPQRRLVDVMGPKRHLGEDLTHEVEGLTIYYARGGTGYLIASSQKAGTYVVYQRERDNAYVTTFRIVAGNRIDGTRHTDGLDVTNFNLGPTFPQGLLVAHDGTNTEGDETNFKLVPWQAIATATNPKLRIDTSWDP